MEKQCRITGLFSYAIKGCRATPSRKLGISSFGVEGDRGLLVLQGDRPSNQVRLPSLTRVKARCPRPGTLEIETDRGSHALAIVREGPRKDIDYYGNRVSVTDQGDAISLFLSEALETEVRLAALPEPYARAIPLAEFASLDGALQDRFVDVAPALVTNEASLADLNSRLETPIPMNRFRPNIVIDGLEPYEEDRVVSLEGPGWRMERLTACERCAVTCTDQESGVRLREPLETLRGYRRREGGYAGGIMFGAYMRILGEGDAEVGQTLTVALAAS